jgi:carboxymethylenebutenolidase
VVTEAADDRGEQAMRLEADSFADLPMGDGVMRLHLLRPAAAGRFPAILLYSEIYQVTAPIRRTAAYLAGHGFLVGVPEVYHEYEPPGTVLAYDKPGTDRGNQLKFAKPVPAYDRDCRAALDHLRDHPASTGALGAFGVCLGGHLAFRAALQPDVKATACFYATDLHTHSLGAGGADGSLDRVGEITGELLMVFGRQDPHVPLDGRVMIRDRLEAAGVNFEWHEVNAAHAFMRDEGPRYDPELARFGYDCALRLFRRALRG